MGTTYSLRDLGVSPGQAKQEQIAIELVPYLQGGEHYGVLDDSVQATLDIMAMDVGTAFRLRFAADYVGPCARCLEPAKLHMDIDSHEVHDPSAEGDGAEELQCDHVDDQLHELDLTGWAQEAVGLKFPTKVLCRRDCLGLCPQCGIELNEHPDHAHEQPTDSRWDALKGLQLEE